MIINLGSKYVNTDNINYIIGSKLATIYFSNMQLDLNEEESKYLFYVIDNKNGVLKDRLKENFDKQLNESKE